MQKAQRLIWDARSLTSSSNSGSIAWASAFSSATIASKPSGNSADGLSRRGGIFGLLVTSVEALETLTTQPCPDVTSVQKLLTREALKSRSARSTNGPPADWQVYAQKREKLPFIPVHLVHLRGPAPSGAM